MRCSVNSLNHWHCTCRYMLPCFFLSIVIYVGLLVGCVKKIWLCYVEYAGLSLSFEWTVALIFTSVTNLLPFTWIVSTIVQFTCNIEGPSNTHQTYLAIAGVTGYGSYWPPWYEVMIIMCWEYMHACVLVHTWMVHAGTLRNSCFTFPFLARFM